MNQQKADRIKREIKIGVIAGEITYRLRERLFETINSLVSEDKGMTMQEVKDTYFPNHTVEELRDISDDYLTKGGD